MFWFLERFNVFELNDVHTFASRVSTRLHVFCIHVCASVFVDKHSSLCKDHNYYLLTFFRCAIVCVSIPKGIEQIDDYASREFHFLFVPIERFRSPVILNALPLMK